MDVILIWQFNVNEYESFISLGHINTIERQAFHLFLSFFVVVYCISFHILFSPTLWLIVRFWFFVFSACFGFVPFDKHTDAKWFALPHVLHFDPNAGQASQ